MKGTRVNGSTTFEGIVAVVLLLLLGAAVYGWIANIVTIAHAVTFSGMIILRAVGIFCFPLGVILGYV